MEPHEACWLTDAQLDEAVEVAARALMDDPDWRAISTDPNVRMEMLTRSFAASLPGARVAGVVRSGRLLGVAAAAEPGTCIGWQLPVSERSSVAPGPEAPPELRLHYFRSILADHDLGVPHWHVGPVGVAEDVRGTGVGGALMAQLCEEFDEFDRVGWVKTVKPENVRFYGRFGFAVVKESSMLGVPLWFLERTPR